MKISPFFFKTLIVVGLASASLATANVLPQETYSRLTEWLSVKVDGTSLKYPDNWELDDSRQLGTSLILFSPQEGDEDNFRENVNLIVQDISAYEITLEEYTELSLEQVKTVIAKSKILENKPTTLDGIKASRVVYTGQDNGMDLKFTQVFTIRNGMAYILTFTAEKEKSEKYATVADKILESFRFEKK